MGEHYLAVRDKGPAWDHSRARREQWGWHARFMDRLVDAGSVVSGGPVGDGDGEEALPVVEASSEQEVRARLAADPRPEEVLGTTSIRRWNVLLRRG